MTRKHLQHSSLLHAASQLLGKLLSQGHLDEQETHRGGWALLTLHGSLVVISVCPTGSEVREESSVSSGILEVLSLTEHRE